MLIIERCSKDARRFIIKALQFNPDNRPTATELLNDPWLVSIAKEYKTDLLPISNKDLMPRRNSDKQLNW